MLELHTMTYMHISLQLLFLFSPNVMSIVVFVLLALCFKAQRCVCVQNRPLFGISEYGVFILQKEPLVKQTKSSMVADVTGRTIKIHHSSLPG